MNEKKFYLNGLVKNFILLMLNGSVIQMFLAECGIPEQNITFYVSLMQIIQLSVMTVFSLFIDKIKNIIRLTAFVYVLAVPILLLSVYFCFNQEMDADLKFGTYLLAGLLLGVGIGLDNGLTYKMPYHVLNMERYGIVEAHSGVIAGVFSVTMSLILAYTQSRYDYFSVMPIFLGVCMLALITYIVNTLTYKENKVDFASTQKKKTETINLFKYKPFTKLIAANLTRGFCFGIVTIAVTIGYYFEILDIKSAGVLVVITNITTILSALVFPLTLKFLGTRKTILIASLFLVFSMPSMFLVKNSLCYLIFYGISYFFVNTINISVPVAITRMIDYKIAGRYHAVRMILHTAGISLSGFVCVGMCAALGGALTMLIAALMQLISGVIYYTYLKKMNVR